MKNIKAVFIGVLFTLLAVVVFNYYDGRNQEEETLKSQTALLEKQVRNVRKLVVTEATYSKIYTYNNTKTYGWDFFNSQKTALLSSNAKVQIAFDLRKMNFQFDQEQQKIIILNIPPPEITIDPNLSFYKLENGLINKFEANDLNTIKSRVEQDLERIIKSSDLIKTSQDRLFSELSQVYVLASNLGWSLEYDGTAVSSKEVWKELAD